MDVDQALFEVGGLRRFNMFLFVTLGFSCMVPTAIDSMMLIFIGWTPKHHCRQYPVGFSNLTEEYQEGLDSCTVPVDNGTQSNITEPCSHGWVYDGDPKTEWSIVSEWDLVCTRDYFSELSEVLAATGCVVGLWICSPLLDRFGRKKCYIISTTMFIFLTMAMSFTQDYIVYLCLRFINVVINECVITGGAVMLIEMFSTEHRTFSGIGLEFVWTLSLLYVAMIYFLVRQWRHFLLVSSIPWVVFLGYIWVLPESVPWLVSNGNVKEAIKVLSFMAKGNGVKWKPPNTILLRNVSSAANLDEAQKLDPSKEEEVDINNASYFKKFVALFKDRYTRKHFFISALLWFANIWVYYGIMYSLPSIASGNKYLSFTIAALVEIPAYVLCMFTVRYSRRWPTVFFHIGAGLMLLVGTAFMVFDIGGKHQHTFLLAFSVTGKFCVTGSFATIVLYINELFPTPMRSTGAGLSKSIGRFGMMLAPSISYVAKKKPWIASLVLGIISIITGVAAFFLPETSRCELANTLKDIHDMYKKPHHVHHVHRNSETLT